jgi:hypothetical protein
LIMDGELWLSMMPASAKTRDLYRDPRILVHSIVASPSPEAEIMTRGTVRAETDADAQRRYAAAVRAHLGWQPVPGEFALFAYDRLNGRRFSDGSAAEAGPSAALTTATERRGRRRWP